LQIGNRRQGGAVDVDLAAVMIDRVGQKRQLFAECALDTRPLAFADRDVPPAVADRD
jgi:hypothetical protein